MSNYLYNPVIGIDVSADFSMVAILKPNGELLRKPFKIKHDAQGFKYLVEQIKKVEKEFKMSAPTFMESTGIYHLNLFHFLKKSSLEVSLLNPLVTHSNKNKDIRKEKSDKKDSIGIAKIGKYENIKVSKDSNLAMFTLRGLCRDHYNLIDSRAKCKNQLTADLKVSFPGYSQVFSDITGIVSTAILSKYPTPSHIKNAPKEEIMKLIALSRKPASWCSKCYDSLIKAADDALEIAVQSSVFTIGIRNSLALINELNNQIDELLHEIKATLESDDTHEALRKNVEFILSIPGVGFITAVTIISEIGDINGFVKPKQLVAYLGIDPSVNQSGKFQGTDIKMSKRGTPYGRRALYAVALASVRKNPNGKPVNTVLRDYYELKKQSKKKKVALGAVMHKLVNYMFAVLRDQKEYEQRSPKLHEKMYLNNQCKNVA